MEDDGAGVGILTNKPMTKPPTLFYGPQPPTPLPPLPPPNDLLGEFAAAQRRASGTLPKWVDHKVERKHVWRRLGVPEAFIVPTLYSAHLVQSHAATPEFPYHVFNRDPPFRVCGYFETLSALRGCLRCTPDFDGTTREGRFLQQHC